MNKEIYDNLIFIAVELEGVISTINTLQNYMQYNIDSLKSLSEDIQKNVSKLYRLIQEDEVKGDKMTSVWNMKKPTVVRLFDNIYAFLSDSKTLIKEGDYEVKLTEVLVFNPDDVMYGQSIIFADKVEEIEGYI